MDVFLGIDTSCYTTSLCLVDDAYEVVADERIILSVAKGGRGLSQSNMVYQHTRNLPVLFERLACILSRAHIRAIAVTDQPRRRDDSYMPAFLAGLGYARPGAVLGVPLYRLSHQENHLLAVLRSLGHIGTDLLRHPLVRWDDGPAAGRPGARGLDITRIGGTSDISAGQFIDRMGVALALPFPAGIHVDKLAQTVNPPVKGARCLLPRWPGQLFRAGIAGTAASWLPAGKTRPAFAAGHCRRSGAAWRASSITRQPMA